MTEVKITTLSSDAIIPTRGSEYAAGCDLYNAGPNTLIESGECKKIHTGIAIELPNNTFGMVCARSGLATKCGLRPANCIGIIDEDYRGELLVALYNDSPAAQLVKQGERIAQLIIVPYIAPVFIPSEELNKTKRGSGGFGSTGTD